MCHLGILTQSFELFSYTPPYSDSHQICLRDMEKLFADTFVTIVCLQAANYLDAKELMELACRTMADMMRGKKAEEIRKIFKIKCDFTPEELEQIRIDSQWAFE